MMQRFRLFVIGLLVGVVAASAQTGRDTTDSSGDFTRYKTYKWLDIEIIDRTKQFVQEEITAALEAELAKKGLAKTESGTADLAIGYQSMLGTKEDVISYHSLYGASVQTIHTGQLGLDMYDPAKKKLVWWGTVSETLDLNAKPDKRHKGIAKAVQKLLKNYPPKQK
jgi:hypothetical protein